MLYTSPNCRMTGKGGRRAKEKKRIRLHNWGTQKRDPFGLSLHGAPRARARTFARV